MKLNCVYHTNNGALNVNQVAVIVQVAITADEVHAQSERRITAEPT